MMATEHAGNAVRSERVAGRADSRGGRPAAAPVRAGRAAGRAAAVAVVDCGRTALSLRAADRELSASTLSRRRCEPYARLGWRELAAALSAGGAAAGGGSAGGGAGAARVLIDAREPEEDSAASGPRLRLPDAATYPGLRARQGRQPAASTVAALALARHAARASVVVFDGREEGAAAAVASALSGSSLYASVAIVTGGLAGVAAAALAAPSSGYGGGSSDVGAAALSLLAALERVSDDAALTGVAQTLAPRARAPALALLARLRASGDGGSGGAWSERTPEARASRT